MTPNTVSLIVRTEAEMQAVVLHITKLSCWFEVTPMPDDEYVITVKEDVAHVAFPKAVQ